MKKIISAALLLLLIEKALFPLTISIVTDRDFTPFCFEERGVVQGIDIDIMREAARRMNLGIKITPLPWKRALVEIKEGNAFAGGMSLFRTPEREEFTFFTGPVHYSRISVFVKKDRLLKFNNIADLYGVTVGINRGFAISDEFDVAVKTGKIRMEEVNSTEQNIQKLLAGRIDCFLGNNINTLYFLKKSEFKGMVKELEKPVVKGKAAYFVFSKKAINNENRWMIQKMKKVLEDIHKDGTYDRIVRKYTE